MPSWYPLRVDSQSRQIVRDAEGYEFATARNIEAAALIVLTMNATARRDFEETS
ncbi:MAG TPA: hypothetical protein VFL96_14825 [Acidobacteriaceae bacterium]|nr:hypothetical protein [Acidobacteriaceae bacterium]